MKKIFYFLILIITYCQCYSPNSLFAQAKILYSISMPFPSNHLFQVEINVEGYFSNSNQYVDFKLPSWRSGRYFILNFSSGIQEFSAEDRSGNNLSWKKTDKDTWRIESTNQDFKVKYKVFANDFSLRTKGLNSEHGFVDASAVLMYIEELRHNNLELNIIPYSGWHVTTGLDKITGSENSYSADTYDYLADCPLLIGTQKDYEFFVNGVKHIVSFQGEGNYNADTVINDLSKIVKTEYNFWGEFPYQHYNFIFQLTTQDFGGTEHLNSSDKVEMTHCFFPADPHSSYF